MRKALRITILRPSVIDTNSPEHSRDWVGTMPSEVSMSGAGHDREPAVEELKRELAETHRREAATAAILKVISRSEFDLQTVLNTLTESATRLCEADDAWLLLREGEFFRYVASYGPDSDVHARIREYFKPLQVPADKGSITGRTALAGRVNQVPDVLADPEYTWSGAQKIRGYRAALGAPLLRKGSVAGVLFITRNAPRPFSPKHSELIETFAGKAVIAIENTRLFEEVQARTRDLTEALEQQTAASEVLSVISRSKFDLQPVFDTMAENAVRLCQAERAFIFRFDGTLLRAAASYNVGPELRDFVDRNPIAPGRHSVSARAAVERRTVHVPDVQSDPEYAYAARDGDLIRTMLAVPLMRGNDLLGTITIYKLEVKPFTDKQIELVQTFADQAVIAIENTRLFEAEEASKRELQESLEYQTAISEVLGVISRSPTDVQPVFDTIARSALHLCAGAFSSVLRFDGSLIHFVAAHGMTPEGFEALRSTYPILPARAGATTRAIETGALAEIPDVDADPDFEHRHVAGAQNFKSLASVPMPKDGRPIGTITVGPGQDGALPQASDRAAAYLRGPSSDRNREHAAVRGGAGEQTRASRISRIPDRDERGPQRHLAFTFEGAARLRHHSPDRWAPLPS
jgi:GAF domain-containing protein